MSYLRALIYNQLLSAHHMCFPFCAAQVTADRLCIHLQRKIPSYYGKRTLLGLLLPPQIHNLPKWRHPIFLLPDHLSFSSVPRKTSSGTYSLHRQGKCCTQVLLSPKVIFQELPKAFLPLSLFVFCLHRILPSDLEYHFLQSLIFPRPRQSPVLCSEMLLFE